MEADGSAVYAAGSSVTAYATKNTTVLKSEMLMEVVRQEVRRRGLLSA